MKKKDLSSLKKHGKTFYFASLFLNRKQAHLAKALYACCRRLDDWVDQKNHQNKLTLQLQNWHQQISSSNITSPELGAFKELSETSGFSLTEIEKLIEGMIFDSQGVKISNQTQLEQYAFCVAGSVGAMMSSILQAPDTRAKKHAIALGIAMQMTNILRDIREDHFLQRQYIPASWLPEDVDLRKSLPNYQFLKPCIEKLFSLAEHHYQFAYLGLHYLPFKSRFAILCALKLYRAIGVKVLRHQGLVLEKRISISKAQKIWLTLKCIFSFVTDRRIHFSSKQETETAFFNLNEKYNANI